MNTVMAIIEAFGRDLTARQLELGPAPPEVVPTDMVPEEVGAVEIPAMPSLFGPVVCVPEGGAVMRETRPVLYVNRAVWERATR